MVILNKIYTKTGDDGTTALGNGERRLKYDARIEAYGTVDEANACLGMARAYASDDFQELDQMLARIQNDLFDLGADLARPMGDEESEKSNLRIIEAQVIRVEKDIDALNKSLDPLRSFILPGGTKFAAALHMARTVSRRAERLAVELSQQPNEQINPACLHYINRVSDFLFVAARYVNNGGKDDVLWVPGENR
jgi:cob(I)alamin adenosyltransferase